MHAFKIFNKIVWDKIFMYFEKSYARALRLLIFKFYFAM